MSWDDNEKVVDARNDNYWRPASPISTDSSCDHPRINTALRAVTASENDLAFSLPAQQKPLIDRAKQLRP